MLAAELLGLMEPSALSVHAVAEFVSPENAARLFCEGDRLFLNAFYAYTAGQLHYQECKFDTLEVWMLPQLPLAAALRIAQSKAWYARAGG